MNKQEESDSQPVAFPINFSGQGPYAKMFDDFGVVFEDNGETGYFYATNASASEIYDAMHIYDRSNGDGIDPGEEIYVVFSNERKRVGLFFHDQFQAVFDFKAQRGVCRTGFPTTHGLWSAGGHKWDDEMIEGLD
jgi:hypothetical protein